MAQSFAEVSWFRFFVIISISFLASMMFNLNDEFLSSVEITRTIIQALIAGVAFLQCPSLSVTAPGMMQKNEAAALAIAIKADAATLAQSIKDDAKELAKEIGLPANIPVNIVATEPTKIKVEDE